MMTVESESVPSQSKTISLNWRCAGSRIRASSRIELRHECRQIPRQRRLEGYRLAADGMDERELVRVQEHALQSFLGQRLVPGEVAVFIVARQWKPEMREMDADLMRATGLQFRLQQGEWR